MDSIPFSTKLGETSRNKTRTKSSRIVYLHPLLYNTPFLFGSVVCVQSAQDLPIYNYHYVYKGEKMFFLLHMSHFS